MAVTSTEAKDSAEGCLPQAKLFNPFSKHFRLETVKLLRVKNMQN